MPLKSASPPHPQSAEFAHATERGIRSGSQSRSPPMLPMQNAALSRILARVFGNAWKFHVTRQRPEAA